MTKKHAKTPPAASKAPPAKTPPKAKAKRVRPGPVVAATRRELKQLGDLGESSLAATALVLARRLDDPKASSTSMATCARALADVLRELRGLAPSEERGDQVDDLSARRRARRAGSAAAPDPARP